MENPTIGAHAHGLTWVIDEPLQRASHALLVEGTVWLVDPVDAGDAIEQAVGLGPVGGVVQLLDRHHRDCAAVAERLGVPHHVLPAAMPNTPLRTVRVMERQRWGEVALWWPFERVLVVAEAVGTAPLFAVGTGAAGVHPMLRLFPPRALEGFEPLCLLVGHGAPLHGTPATWGLSHALRHSRRDIPRMLLALPKLRRS